MYAIEKRPGEVEMSVLSFAEDFSRLILRYTKNTINVDQSKDVSKPLTYEEIASTISNVLSALGLMSTDLKSVLDSSVDSSVNTTVLSTPALSPIRRKQDDRARRFSISGEILDSNLDLSRLSLGTDETEVKTPLNGLRNAMKFISRSNPTIRINNIGRSDTFVCKKDQMEATNENEVFEDASVVETDDSLNDSFLESFGEMRKSVMEIATKLDKLEERAYLQSTKQRQRLYKSNCSSEVGQTATLKTNVPVVLHRSVSTFSGTPTSKSRAPGKENVSSKRKSISNASAVRTERLNRSANVGRSMSNLNLCDKAPPSSSSTSFRPPKNSRYAHVQSTIPKPSRPSNKKA
ncbi:hypothetical protein HN011_001078 [Eciton burchellii]|nr:hypothetical protein HN011_001078 [Eciton burchellii]